LNPRRYTFIAGIAVVLAAGIGWWLWPVPAHVDARAGIAAPTQRDAPVHSAKTPVFGDTRNAPPPSTAPAPASAPAPLDDSRDSPHSGLRIDDNLRRQLEQDFGVWYEDAGAALGLDADQSFALTRTLIEQAIRQMELPFNGDRMALMESSRELRQAQREDLRALLGADRLARLDQYERSIGARQDVQELMRYSSVNPALSDTRRRELVRAAIDAGAYFDMPKFTGAESSGALTQEYLAKMELRDAKMLDAVRRVLGAEYVESIRAVQEARREGLEGTLRNQR
jgi:hypothetical protein